MARKVLTTLVDDIHGMPIEEGQGESISFALDGVNYEIDLSDDNAAKLRTALEDYIDKGHRLGRAAAGTAAPHGSAGLTPKQDLGAAREWLRKRGHKVSERGRISVHLLEEYRANS
ncbi:Lsr2 family protein (plasmid) [Clavibacter capsici]|uniref:Lsr2 family protein n=1 Tax=Clavibacter capsici TaxID=1874630 RepID=A0A0M5JT02_9MICO|nr:Lsr2 family protein [Clavibacter capsici]ALD14410.1 hypothetical protein AES38_15150 [Clavibacter capsici]QIS40552.1 Lsr2 family protein [Clavibacter capsici]QIS43517.1 Lsr2 family protein [Clavibacter capsici]QIS46437.1 Lsr2 family protein [Clavibacter capsici]